MTSRLAAARLIAGYAAIASALPYLTLKLLWLGGVSLGVKDPSIMLETNMVVLNALTVGMDAVGIMLAFAFAHEWRSRMPAWLLLPPMWVATGLLSTFVVAVPIMAILSAVAPRSLPPLTGGPVEGWVNVLVYIAFAGMGTGLMVAFSLYARTRWASVFQPPTQVRHSSPFYDLQVVLANATALGATALGLLHLAWAVGARVGLAENAATRRTIIGSVINGLNAALMMGASAGVLMMFHRIGGSLPRWLPLSMTWVGSGSLFAWGLWQTINVLGETALMRGTEGRAFVNLVGLGRLVVGLTMGLLFLLLVAERHERAGTAPP